MVHDLEKPVKQRRLCLNHDHVIKGACVEQQQKVRQLLSQVSAGLVVRRGRSSQERDTLHSTAAAATERLVEQLLQEITQFHSSAYSPDFIKEMYGALQLCLYWCWYSNKGNRWGSEQQLPSTPPPRRRHDQHTDLQDWREDHGTTPFFISSKFRLYHDSILPMDQTCPLPHSPGDCAMHDDTKAILQQGLASHQTRTKVTTSPSHSSSATSLNTMQGKPLENANGDRPTNRQPEEPGVLDMICECLGHMQRLYHSFTQIHKKNDHDCIISVANEQQLNRPPCASLTSSHSSRCQRPDETMSLQQNPIKAMLSLRFDTYKSQQQEQNVQVLLLRTWFIRSSWQFQHALDELDTENMQRLLSLLLQWTNTILPDANDSNKHNNYDINLLAARILIKCMNYLVNNNHHQYHRQQHDVSKLRQQLHNIATAELQAIALQVLLLIERQQYDDDERIHSEVVHFLCTTMTLQAETTGLTDNATDDATSNQQQEQEACEEQQEQHQQQQEEQQQQQQVQEQANTEKLPDSALEVRHTIDEALARILGNAYTRDATKRTILLHYFQRLSAAAGAPTSVLSSLARIPHLVESLVRVAMKRSTDASSLIDDDDDDDDDDSSDNDVNTQAILQLRDAGIDTRDTATMATVLLFELSKDVSNKRILAKQSGVLACMIRHVREHFVPPNATGRDEDENSTESKRQEWKEQIMALATAL